MKARQFTPRSFSPNPDPAAHVNDLFTLLPNFIPEHDADLLPDAAAIVGECVDYLGSEGGCYGVDAAKETDISEGVDGRVEPVLRG